MEKPARLFEVAPVFSFFYNGDQTDLSIRRELYGKAADRG
jgi:hypothetical protein